MLGKSPEIVAAIEAVVPGAMATIKAGNCPLCHSKITKFRDELSKREYYISGMCQHCQDSIFGGYND